MECARDAGLERRDELIKLLSMDQKDVDLVISQASCTRVQAIKALRTSRGDIINAIMELTDL